MLNTLLVSREVVILWGLPQIEDRALETLQQEWRLYQARLADTRAQLNSALAKLRQMEQKFQRLDSWLKGMETKAQLRSHRRSDRATKEAQLQLIKVSVTCTEVMLEMFCTVEQICMIIHSFQCCFSCCDSTGHFSPTRIKRRILQLVNLHWRRCHFLTHFEFQSNEYIGI